MRKKRFSEGAINFSSQEVRFQLDESGKPIGVTIKESKEAHQLIEEFMLLANKTVAEYVSKSKSEQEPRAFPLPRARYAGRGKDACICRICRVNSGINSM